jgi:CRISPR-associated endonuclease Csn1
VKGKILTQANSTYVLGLDLGSNSVGWAMVYLDRDGKPSTLGPMGVRIFEAGVEGDIDEGKDQPRGQERREKRQVRRQHDRTGRRLAKTFRILQQMGLLPPSISNRPDDRHHLLLNLDVQLRAVHLPADRPEAQHLLPFLLRAQALDGKLEPFALGRAIYHLSQRRGFNSNRRNSSGKDEDTGVVKAGIASLEEACQDAGARTLGEYFSTLDPEVSRIRSRYTSRQMHLDEFIAIRDAQMPHHNLTPEQWLVIERSIFFQRPLKSSRHLIGKCEVVPGKRRASVAIPLAQRFRLLQKVNDLIIEMPDQSRRGLTADERKKLLDVLENEGDQTFVAIRKMLKLRGTKFNLEEGGEKRIVGNRTRSKMLEVLGVAWDAMTSDRQHEIIYDLLHYQKRDQLKVRAMRDWGLDAKTAGELVDVQLEDGHSRFCKPTLARLVERMKDGTHLATALKEEDPSRFGPGIVYDLLPALAKAIPDMRSPAVARCLTELRKVVNDLIRNYGKPTEIRVELARNLKQPRQKRADQSKQMRTRESQREKAKVKICNEVRGIDYPKRADVDKVLLANECGWRCPYTGRKIEMKDLVGPNPQFDVEHIIPFSKCLDNSFLNKTLCYHEENRSQKRHLTPWQAYSRNPAVWDAIISRVKTFEGPTATIKLERFQMNDTQVSAFYGDFTERHLADTRYASCLAKEYLGSLFGGEVDASGKRRVQATTGVVTAYLRDIWGLSHALGDARKSRDDHRHHAVDAVAIALTTPSIIKRLSEAAQRAERRNRYWFDAMELPWPTFNDDLLMRTSQIIVSHRPSRRLRGELHKATIYSKPMVGVGKRETVHHVRTELVRLTQGDLANDSIVDPVVRKLVKDAYERAGGGAMSSVFGNDANLPHMISRSGKSIPIKRVRVRDRAKPVSIGGGSNVRYVNLRSNHHAVFFGRVNPDGSQSISGFEVVSRMEAFARHRARRPIVDQTRADGTVFLFSLSSNECIMWIENGVQVIARIRGVSSGSITVQMHNDARMKKVLLQDGELITIGMGRLRKLNPQKVLVLPSGNLRTAH